MIIQPKQGTRNENGFFLQQEAKRIAKLNEVFGNVELTNNEERILIWLAGLDDMTVDNIVSAVKKTIDMNEQITIHKKLESQYEETPDRVKQGREVGQSLKGFEHSVSASWIKQGYIKEQAEPRAANKFVTGSTNGSVHDKLEKFQQEAKERADTDNPKQREDRQEER